MMQLMALCREVKSLNSVKPLSMLTSRLILLFKHEARLDVLCGVFPNYRVLIKGVFLLSHR